MTVPGAADRLDSDPEWIVDVRETQRWVVLEPPAAQTQYSPASRATAQDLQHLTWGRAFVVSGALPPAVARFEPHWWEDRPTRLAAHRHQKQLRMLNCTKPRVNYGTLTPNLSQR
jgi:hypothetical protein